MKKREPVSTIMTTHVNVAKESDSLKEVMAVFKREKIRHMPVVKGHEVTGIISATDLNRLTFGGLFENQDDADEAVLEMLSVPQVMTSHPKTVNAHDSIKEVAEIFAKEPFHALPVVDGTELKGIVTTTDIIQYMLEQY